MAIQDLERQNNSSLFKRLVSSKDEKGVFQLSEKGHLASHPTEMIKDPDVLDFLKIPQSNRVTEKHQKQKIIDNLQGFF